jgi:hypothetical protein
MRRAIAVALTLAVGLSTADARHRHRHYRGPDQPLTGEQQDAVPANQPDQRSTPSPATPRSPTPSLAQLIPRDWVQQKPDPNWSGKRFTSPDGSASVAIFTAPVDQTKIAPFMKDFAFVDGEKITDLRAQQNWIAVAGNKSGDRLFYREAVIACAGRTWHQIAFEYPTSMKAAMARFVSDAAVAVLNSENDGCDKELWSSTVRQNEVAR